MVFDIGHTIRKLQTYNNSSYEIISTYLSLQQNKISHALLQKTFQRLVEKTLSPQQREDLAQDITYINGFLSEFKNTQGYQSLIIFAGNNNLWEVVTSHFPVKNMLTVAHGPFLDPLLGQIEDQQHFLVVLTDREKALYFVIHNGVIERQGQTKDTTVPHHGIGRNESMLETNMQNREQQHLNKHLALIGEKVTQFTKNIPIAGVIVGGHKTLIHKTEKYLSKNLQEKVIGEFVSELNIDNNQIIEKSDTILSLLTHPVTIRPQAGLMNP